MRIIGKIFAVLFAIVFVLTLPVALTLYNVQAGLVSADTYKNALIDKKIYDQAPIAAASQLEYYASTSNPASDPSIKMLRSLSADDMAKAIGVMLPVAIVQPAVESLIDQIFVIINEGKGSVSVNTAAIKQSILGNGVAALHGITDSKPACTKQQLQELAQGGLPMCQLPKENAAQVDAQLNKMLTSLAGNVPDNLDLVSTDKVAQMQEQLSYIGLARNMVVASLLVPLLALGLIALFTVRSKRSLMRWWGVPLLLAGLITIGINKTAGAMGGDAIREQISQAGLTKTTADFLFELYGGVAGAVLTPMFIESILAIVVGLALIIGVRWLPKAEDAQASTAA